MDMQTNLNMNFKIGIHDIQLVNVDPDEQTITVAFPSYSNPELPPHRTTFDYRDPSQDHCSCPGHTLFMRECWHLKMRLAFLRCISNNGGGC